LDPENVPFDISPLLGDLFAQQTINSGHFQFNVVAMDSSGRVIFCFEAFAFRNF
jgi:hypothetical protein